MIECLRYKKHDSGTLKGFADLVDNELGLEFFGCSCHTSQGKSWVNLPSKEYDDNGVRKYFNVIRFKEKDRYLRWMLEAKEAIKNYIQNEPEPVSVQPEQEEEIPF